MALTKLGATGTSLEINDVTLTEADTVLMRDGRDVHTELTRRGKTLTDDTITFTRTELGDIEVTATHNTKVRER